MLDADKRFARVPDPETEQAAPGLRVAAEYELLSEPSDSDEQYRDVLADITIVDVVDSSEAGGKEPMAWVVSLDSDNESAAGIFREVASNLAKESDEESAEPQVISRLPEICRPFDWKVHSPGSPDNLSGRKHDEQRLQSAIEKWLDIVQDALDGKSPAEAGKDESLRTRLAGGVLVLDVVCNRMGYDPDLSGIREQLNIPAPEALEVDEERSITAMPMLQFSRLDAAKLNDRQVVEFANRITLIRHLRLLSAAVDELVRRPDALEQFSPMRAHLLRATVAREQNNLKLASECFAAARESIDDDGDAFELDWNSIFVN